MVVYIFAADAEKQWNEAQIIATLDEMLVRLEDHSFNDEFNYLKFGFSMVHFGRRGITITIWHWGKWGETLELFWSGWYAFHDHLIFDSLTAQEPVMCIYECDAVANELRIMRDWCDLSNLATTRQNFLSQQRSL